MRRQCPTCGKFYPTDPTLSLLPQCPLTTIAEKATWMGCGQHVPMVMDSISESDWCTCSPKTVVDGKEYPPKMGQGKKSEAPKVEVGYEA